MTVVAHASAHDRPLLPTQRAFRQPRIRYRPTAVLSDDELESIHLASLRVLAEIGMDFLDEGARNLLKDAGAEVESGSLRVRFDPQRIPSWVWHFDGVPTAVIAERWPATEAVEPNRFGELNFTFRNLRQGLGYGHHGVI